MTNRPNFFIVGAPKCGTTSLYETLRQHSRVFMPFDKQNYWITKEPGFFCPELIDHDLSHWQQAAELPGSRESGVGSRESGAENRK